MYLKSDRELFRRRVRFPWGCALVVVMLLVGAGFLAYQALPEMDNLLSVSVPTATPVPTPTPSAEYHISRAEDAYFDGSVGEAIAAYQQALDMEPNRTELYLTLARLLIYEGKPERGLEMARQALLRQPESARAWGLLGLAYDWLGLPEEAITFGKRAVQLDPTLPEAYAYLAEAYIDAGQWAAATDAINTGMELDATNVDVLRNRAYVLENQGNYYGAIERYRDALAVNDKLVHLYIGMGRNAGALGDLVRANAAYEDAVEVDPNHAMALDRLGWTQLMLGEYDAAEVNLLSALEQDPDLVDAYGHLGTLYFHQRNYEDAIELFGPGIRYGEARSRRRTVRFVITTEEGNSIGAEPQGPEVAVAQFVHPESFQAPLRGQFQSVDGRTDIQGSIRFDVLGGRYEVAVSGMPSAPSGKVYVGWFVNLTYPEGGLVHTAPIYSVASGQIELTGNTGSVKGPAIENYYNYALCYYMIDECDKAMPLIETALRINPQDANALQTWTLCQ